MREELPPLRFHFLDCETDGDRKDPAIATIQTWDLSDPLAPLVIRKAWAHPRGERGILEDFCRETAFFRRKWDFVPCGFNLAYEFKVLWARAKRYGVLDAFADRNEWEKPHLDLQHWAILANGGQLAGASLDAYSKKSNSGAAIPNLLRERRFEEVEAYIRDEARAFRDLCQALVREVPAHWASTVAPSIGLATARVMT